MSFTEFVSDAEMGNCCEVPCLVKGEDYLSGIRVFQKFFKADHGNVGFGGGYLRFFEWSWIS